MHPPASLACPAAPVTKCKLHHKFLMQALATIFHSPQVVWNDQHSIISENSSRVRKPIPEVVDYMAIIKHDEKWAYMDLEGR